VNSYIARFFLSIFVAEIQRPNAMVGGSDDQAEVSLLFTVAAGTCLAKYKILGYE
jgi:hypothetical protein